MNLFAEMRFLVIAALDKMTVAGELPEGLSFDNVAVEPPRDALHGDMATNAAMVLAKPSRRGSPPPMWQGRGFLTYALPQPSGRVLLKKPSSKAPHSAGLLLGQAGG